MKKFPIQGSDQWMKSMCIVATESSLVLLCFKKLIFILFCNYSVVHPTPVEGRADFQDPGLSDIMGQSNERLNEDNLPHDLPEIEVMRDAIHDLHSENLPVGGNAGFQDPGPSHQMEQLNEMFNEETVPQEVPEMEVMRDAVHDLQSERLPVWPEHGNDTTELDRSLDQMLNEKEILSPNMPDILYSGEQSLPFQQRSEPPASAVSPEAPEIFDSHISFGGCLISSLAIWNGACAFRGQLHFALFEFAFSCFRACVTRTGNWIYSTC